MARALAAHSLREDTFQVGCVFRAISRMPAPAEVTPYRRAPWPRREVCMTTYIVLMNWTEQGAKSVRDSPKRLDAARKQLGDMGGSFKAFYLTMGEYDMVAVVEAPDDAVLARFSLMLAAAGNVRTRTLKAFPEFAYREIISSLG
ncbi:mll2465 [Mesorhizobium japonicum MAFF 303099]|uniref:Mll2465 protein n=5 Tax=Mesorhizobium TaxID=68287 RepID=Q98IC6_RHILO|nr:mll2465 [Mesorhizobium japonicum MAFF 303099]